MPETVRESHAEARAEQTFAQTSKQAAEKIAQSHNLIAEKLDQLRKSRSGRIAQAVEQAWGELKAPPKRLGSKPVPLPYSEPLESYVLVDADDIIGAIREVLG